jgi:hypothetical protein
MFEAFGGSPGNTYHWVDLKDDLTASLLQARLIELNLRSKWRSERWTKVVGRRRAPTTTSGGAGH